VDLVPTLRNSSSAGTSLPRLSPLTSISELHLLSGVYHHSIIIVIISIVIIGDFCSGFYVKNTGTLQLPAIKTTTTQSLKTKKFFF